ncbi:hypothetical protein BD414DRAFT_539599 [Trametes punicea]|nr:hypothetical protein BD414DRAFT_539599 [Trametes punicea]
MLSPIAIPRATKPNHGRRDSDDAHKHAAVSRSLPANSSALYVPVHRRAASVTSLSERDSAPLSSRHLAKPALNARPRSVSPPNVNRYDLPVPANIPRAPTIPQTHSCIYSPVALLAFASSPAVGLSPSQRALVDSHISLMVSRTSYSRPKKASQPTEITKTTQPAAAAETQKKPDSAPRRRRTGRKPSGAKMRTMPPTEVDARRRRGGAYGAGWGWSAVERVTGQRAEYGRVPARLESWRGAGRTVVAAA